MRSAHGFTLVELLVVISIIAILSVIGITVFTGVQKGARDGKRRADIGAITKAFETKYNNAGSYGNLDPTIQENQDLFASGQFPKDPRGVDYTILENESTGGFAVCAVLDNNQNQACAVLSQDCFCKGSAQADPPTVTNARPVSNQDLIGDTLKTAVTTQVLNQVYDAIIQARINQNKVLWRITGSGCTYCNCSTGLNQTCMNVLTTTYGNLGMSTIPEDGWGDPIWMDENEHEFGTNDCREDWIWARGQARNIPYFICPN